MYIAEVLFPVIVLEFLNISNFDSRDFVGNIPLTYKDTYFNSRFLKIWPSTSTLN